jgi:5'(3')-deoxyribonucleotidase
MKIGIDLDEVLSQTAKALIEFHNDTYGTNYKIKKLNTFVWQIWSKTLSEAEEKISIFFKTLYFKKIKPVLGAREVLEKLKKNNKLFIITARSDDIKVETEKWVEKYYPKIFSQIYFTNKFSLDGTSLNKKIMCDNLGINILVEDNLENALGCVGPNRKIYLLDYPWNQTDKLPKDIIRVHSWKEIEKKIL